MENRRALTLASLDHSHPPNSIFQMYPVVHHTMIAGLAGVVRRMNVGVVTAAVSWLLSSLEALASDVRRAKLGAS